MERSGLIYIVTVNHRNNSSCWDFLFTVTQVLFSHMKDMGLKDTSVEQLEKKYAVFS